MKKWCLFLFSAIMAGCTAQSASLTQGQLAANADAQHVGVYSYAVDRDVVTLYDRYGMELGQVTVTSPSAEGRHFELAAADGTTDEADVGRPMHDGTFRAPVTPETLLTATMGDPALAAHWAAHQLTFVVDAAPRLTRQGLAIETEANTATCNSYACGQSCTPAGCAKPGNTSLGCTNPSVLYPQATVWWSLAGTSYADTATCNAHVVADCVAKFGGTTADWSVNMGTNCYVDVPGRAYCGTSSQNTWTASCPRQTCQTPGQYDAVPRIGSCVNPGSCNYSQGTVTCTQYH